MIIPLVFGIKYWLSSSLNSFSGVLIAVFTFSNELFLDRGYISPLSCATCSVLGLSSETARLLPLISSDSNSVNNMLCSMSSVVWSSATLLFFSRIELVSFALLFFLIFLSISNCFLYSTTCYWKYAKSVLCFSCH
jgi:hypothetical protein